MLELVNILQRYYNRKEENYNSSYSETCMEKIIGNDMYYKEQFIEYLQNKLNHSIKERIKLSIKNDLKNSTITGLKNNITVKIDL